MKVCDTTDVERCFASLAALSIADISEKRALSLFAGNAKKNVSKTHTQTKKKENKKQFFFNILKISPLSAHVHTKCPVA